MKENRSDGPDSWIPENSGFPQTRRVHLTPTGCLMSVRQTNDHLTCSCICDERLLGLRKLRKWSSVNLFFICLRKIDLKLLKNILITKNFTSNVFLFCVLEKYK